MKEAAAAELLKLDYSKWESIFLRGTEAKTVFMPNSTSNKSGSFDFGSSPL